MKYLIGLLLLSGCQGQSLEEFREEGSAITYSLIQELQAIDSKEDLIAKKGSIKKLFNRLVALAGQAANYQKNHPQDTEALYDAELSDHLREVMIQLYAIDGAREIIEQCQKDALEKLYSIKM